VSWVAALVLAGVLCAAGARWWVRVVEPRLFTQREPLPPLPRQRPASSRPERAARPVLPPGDEGHLSFALALRAAADLYVEECEARAGAHRPPFTSQ
jgi:hypothetical protein